MIFPASDRASITNRFAEKYIPEPNSGCWLWVASSKGNGYGQFQLRHRRGMGPEFAHRVSYELHCGEIPEGKVVLHVCDNRACVNPDHLRVGTVADNSHDMVSKNRGRGQFLGWGRSAHTRISQSDVLSILVDDRPTKEIAKSFGVSERHVRHVKRGERRRTIEKVAQIFKR